MYCAKNIQMVDLITILLEVIEEENGNKIEISVRLEAEFQTD